MWESPDCDIMSDRFLRFALTHGIAGHIVRVDSVDEGPHWFTVLTDPQSDRLVAIDWTAKQFYNAGYPAPAADPKSIPCPLVFEWPGRYPLDVVEFELVRSP